MVKKLEVCVAAAVVSVAATTATTLAQRVTREKEDNITNKIFLKVMSIIFWFASLLQEEIVRIFQNKFKPINFYCFHHICGLQFNFLYDQDRISIKDGMLKLQKTFGTYKNFGKSFYKVWANAFHNYTIICNSLFDKKASDLHFALAKFYSNVYELSIVYK